MRGNASTSRALNRRLILNLLRNRGSISRAELALATGLSPAAVTFVVTELMDDALVVEREAVSSANGRRPIPVDINYEAHLALGFKLNRDNIACVLTDLATTPLATLEARVEDTTPEGMIRAIEEGTAGPRATMVPMPILVMESEHEQAGEQLVRMRELTAGYALPAGACNSYRALFAGLEELEAETHAHVHLENNVLFLRVLDRALAGA